MRADYAGGVQFVGGGKPMKIRLSAQGMSLNVEVTDDKAMTVYRGMAEKLLVHAELQNSDTKSTE